AGAVAAPSLPHGRGSVPGRACLPEPCIAPTPLLRSEGKELTTAEEEKVAALVKKAVSPGSTARREPLSKQKKRSSLEKSGARVPPSRRDFLAAATGAAASVLMGGAAASRAEAQSGPAAPAGVQYRIHPAIGIARVGNADPSTYFIGPEAPGF